MATTVLDSYALEQASQWAVSQLAAYREARQEIRNESFAREKALSSSRTAERPEPAAGEHRPPQSKD